MKKNSLKWNRINTQLQKVLGELIRSEVKDPRVGPMTSVTLVAVAPDLKTCKVWVSALGDQKVREDTIKGLKNAEGFLRTRLAKEVNLRTTPELTFLMDESIEYGMEMSRKIDELMEQEEKRMQTP
ncbi:MAG: 30S ribosome-binding factor RbfA [Lachnospiraceae bacterium]|jgi:ribosome-binding factor A|nr:30S ribosome-binding factor RbfA [Lachnospiraceae bacterium]